MNSGRFELFGAGNANEYERAIILSERQKDGETSLSEFTRQCESELKMNCAGECHGKGANVCACFTGKWGIYPSTASAPAGTFSIVSLRTADT